MPGLAKEESKLDFVWSFLKMGNHFTQFKIIVYNTILAIVARTCVSPLFKTLDYF